MGGRAVALVLRRGAVLTGFSGRAVAVFFLHAQPRFPPSRRLQTCPCSTGRSGGRAEQRFFGWRSVARRAADALGVFGHVRANRSSITGMKVATGKVVEGKVVVDGVALEEGSLVTVLTREAEGTFELSPGEEAELLLSIAEADRGEMFSGEEVLESLPRRRT